MKLLTEKEAANALRVCQKTFIKQVKLGKIPFIAVAGVRRYDPADIATFTKRSKTTWPEKGKPRPIINTTLPCKVVGIEEALKRTPKQKPLS